MSSLMLVQTNMSELEVELTPTAKPRFPNTGVLLIHPFSGLGGSMNDFVIAELHRSDDDNILGKIPPLPSPIYFKSLSIPFQLFLQASSRKSKLLSRHALQSAWGRTF